jgi:hypothetical protein
MNKGDTPSDAQLTEAVERFLQALNADSDEELHRIQSGAKFIDAFIVFDEAHTLAGTHDTAHDSHESRFVVLRRVLRALSPLPLFSFFLSTAGKVTQFGQVRGEDRSNRINGGTLVSPRPYVSVGFDQLSYKFKQGQTIQYVTSLRFVAHLGRPLYVASCCVSGKLMSYILRWGSLYDHGTDVLHNELLHFAVQKLLCASNVTKDTKLNNSQIYATLSQRLALDVNSTQYPGAPQGPLEIMHTLHEQVANHMRVCVAVGNGIETLYAVASSEPILSEAASYVMRLTNLSMANALKLVLSGFGISQGDRGELLVAALFTCARDLLFKTLPITPMVQLCPSFSVVNLFSTLFQESAFNTISKSMPSLCRPKAAELPFEQAFKNTSMHFNHFIKPQDRAVISRGYLLLYMARGAAAWGANCQPGFDAIYPFICGDNLVRKQVGFIIVQVKNDSNVYRSKLHVFPGMDPFTCGLLEDSDLEDDGTFPIPIIRLLFLLAKSPGIKQQIYLSPSHGASKGLAKDGSSRFTSYDFEISGISPEVFHPVAKDQSPMAWNALINQSEWSSLYHGDDEDVVRAQLPGGASAQAHWTSWVEGLEGIVAHV